MTLNLAGNLASLSLYKSQIYFAKQEHGHHTHSAHTPMMTNVVNCEYQKISVCSNIAMGYSATIATIYQHFKLNSTLHENDNLINFRHAIVVL